MHNKPLLSDHLLSVSECLCMFTTRCEYFVYCGSVSVYVCVPATHLHKK